MSRTSHPPPTQNKPEEEEKKLVSEKEKSANAQTQRAQEADLKRMNFLKNQIQQQIHE